MLLLVLQKLSTYLKKDKEKKSNSYSFLMLCTCIVICWFKFKCIGL